LIKNLYSEKIVQKSSYNPLMKLVKYYMPIHTLNSFAKSMK